MGRVIEWGVYCVFTYIRSVEIKVVSHEKEPGSFYYVLNCASGEIEEMKANSVKKFLADDWNLAGEYKNEDDKEGQMLEYLRRYDRLHPITKCKS